MKIAPNFKKSYPKLSAWIEVNMPKVKTKPKVWLALTSGQFSGSRFPNRVYLAKSICERF